MGSDGATGGLGVGMLFTRRSIADRRRHAAGVALWCTGLLLAGCGEDNTLSLVRPRLELAPEPGTTMTFDPVVLTRSKAAPLFIRAGNSGDGVLRFERIEIEGPDAADFELTDKPVQIVPGAEEEIWFRFQPVTPGEKQAVLRLVSNDPDRPDVSYPLVGPAREPCVIFANEQRLLFQVGEKRTVTLRSLSSNACTIDRVFVDQSVFPLTNLPEVPFVISGGQELTFEVEHRAVRPQFPGAPVRELLVRESEGTELRILLEGEPPLSGCLSALPLEIAFQQTRRGETRRQRVSVSNRCGRAATITSVGVGLGWEAFEIRDQTFPMTVPPGARADVWITYVPQTAFDLGRVTINTNDAAAPKFRVLVQGEAAIPAIEVFPFSLDFGSVIYRDLSGMAPRSECASAARFARIHSTGAAPLRVERLSLEGDSDAFEITGVTIDGAPVQNFAQPFDVPINRYAEVALQFYPTRSVPAAHDARLVVHHDGDGREPRAVALTGLAAVDGSTTDSFQQLTGPKVDILWVIDDSCSMYDEQARLIGNMSQFVAYADSRNADYQMGVIVTDSRSPDAGKLEFCYPHPRIVRHTYPQREEAFRCLFNVGTNGSYIEAGLGAARRALELAVRTGDDPVRNPNMGFLRDDASLAIVAMSDEDDQSLESDDLLLDFFRTIKGRPSRTSVHAIGGPLTGSCPSNPNQPPGYRYNWMVQQMGGLYQNICLEDWQPVLRNLGLNVFVPIDEWELTQSADPASVTVSVDGRPVVWDMQNGFTYSPARNAISFHGTAVPPPGATITVDYVGNCRP